QPSSPAVLIIIDSSINFHYSVVPREGHGWLTENVSSIKGRYTNYEGVAMVTTFGMLKKSGICRCLRLH
ncbi:hypothetical protein, partial [Paenibacillus sp. yr247]|uniref:hypothetical protein n=1 Tax=Paenibacillus sp. yr247 TaxID=1761880 RepID=UPI001C31332C